MNNSILINAVPAPSTKSAWKEILLLVLLCAGMFGHKLGKRDIWTSGEARVAQVARQMRTSGDYVLPMLGDEPRLKKPPMAYWLCLIASMPFDDVDEFNSRIPSAVAATLIALILCLWGRKLIGGYGGLIAGAAFATTCAAWWQARNSTIEMTLLFFTVSTLFCWWKYDTQEAEKEDGSVKTKRPWWLILAYIFLAGAALDKGPVTPPLILLIVFTYLISGRRSPIVLKWFDPIFIIAAPVLMYFAHPDAIGRAAMSLILIITYFYLVQRNPLRFKVSHHIPGIIFFLALTLPWTVMVTLRAGKGPDGEWKTLGEWIYQSAGRFEGFDHIKEFWYFFVKILGDGQPWVFFALLGLVAWFWKRPAAGRNGIRFFVSWMLVTLVFYSIPASKKSYYILPIYPALAMLAAWHIERLHLCIFENTAHEKWAVRVSIFTGALCVLLGLALPFIPEHAFARMEGMSKYENTPLIMISAALAIFYGFMLGWKAWKRDWRTLAGWTVVATCAGFTIYNSFLDNLNLHKNDRIFCSAVRSQLRPSDDTYTFSMGGQPVYKFYLNRQVTRLETFYQLAAAMKEVKPGDRMVLGISLYDWNKWRGVFVADYSRQNSSTRGENDLQKKLQTNMENIVGADHLPKAAFRRKNREYRFFNLKLKHPGKRDAEEAWEPWKKDVEAALAKSCNLAVVLGNNVNIKPLNGVFRKIAEDERSDRIWVEFVPET